LHALTASVSSKERRAEWAAASEEESEVTTLSRADSASLPGPRGRVAARPKVEHATVWWREPSFEVSPPPLLAPTVTSARLLHTARTPRWSRCTTRKPHTHALAALRHRRPRPPRPPSPSSSPLDASSHQPSAQQPSIARQGALQAEQYIQPRRSSASSSSPGAPPPLALFVLAPTLLASVTSTTRLCARTWRSRGRAEWI